MPLAPRSLPSVSERPDVERKRAAHLGPERRRPEVLDRALALFRQHGYAGTSIEMIAGAARVTRPVVYACYPSKTALFRALLDREERRLMRQIVEALPDRASVEDPEQMLIDGFTAIFTAAQIAPDSWGVVFLSEHGATEIGARVERARNQVRERLAELTRPVLASRGVEDPGAQMAKLVAHLLMGNAEAGVRLMLSEPDQWTPRELGRLVGRMSAPALAVIEQETG